jgi:two-component system, cell cycle sensor histidine kinase and response regulator CckA
MDKKKSRILIVEDERIVAEDIQKSLDNLGYDIAGLASSGTEALKLVQKTNPDLVLMDIVLKDGMNGIQTAETIYGRHHIPVVYLTAYADEETLDRAKRTEPYGYILKPFDDRELQTTIEMAIYKHGMERKVKESEAWLSTTLKSIGDAVITTDVQGKITFINPVAQKVTGYASAEAIGKPLNRIFKIESELTGKAVENPVERILKEGIIVGLANHTNLIDKKGRKIPIDDSGAPIVNEKGQIIGVVLVFQDITTRRQAEADLKKSEAEKRMILSSVSELVLYIDSNHRIIWANKAAAELSQCDPEDMKGRRCHEMWLKRKKTCPGCPILLTKKTGKMGELEIVNKDGRHWLIRNYPAYDDDGRFAGIVEVARDITAQKKAEDLLEREKRFISTLLQTAPVFYFAIDRNGKTLMMNQTLLKALGYSEKDVAGQDYLARFVAEEDRSQVKAVFQKLVREKEPVLHENRVFSKTGKTILMEWHGKSIFDTKGRFEYFFGVGIDVTQRRQMEKEKERMEGQLLQVQKMEAIGTLTGGVAHDFNNLLTAIQGCTDMALMKTEETNPIYFDLREIQKASLRAADLTRQLLLFSSRHPIRFSLISLNKVVDDLLKMVHRLIGEDIGISTALDPDLWAIRADKGTVEQVIMNLAVNARDAMPNGGKLTIRTENLRLTTETVKSMPEARPGPFVRMTVTDTGHGMDPETIEHIFEPFYSTKGPGRGTGLGLSVVYGIIRQHQGWIRVESVLNAGTTFEIVLPAVMEKAKPMQEETDSLAGLQGTGERILIVEDADGVRQFLQTALKDNGYAVFSVSTVGEALSLYEKEKGRFDLIFSDVVLPDKSGIDLIEQLLDGNPKLNILLSSGYTDHKSQWPRIQQRKFQYLQKPYSLKTLLRTVQDMLKKP